VADDNQETNVSEAAEDAPNAALEAQLAAEKAEYKDRMLRTLADFDNFRRRAERDRSEYVQFAYSRSWTTSSARLRLRLPTRSMPRASN
jgi:molecular chaperone GrpE (heat shock protein)